MEKDVIEKLQHKLVMLTCEAERVSSDKKIEMKSYNNVLKKIKDEIKCVSTALKLDDETCLIDMFGEDFINSLKSEVK